MYGRSVNSTLNWRAIDVVDADGFTRGLSSRLAAARHPRTTKAAIRIVQAKLTPLLNSLFNMMGKTIPPTEQPVHNYNSSSKEHVTEETKLAGENDTHRHGTTLAPSVRLHRETRYVNQSSTEAHSYALGEDELIVFLCVRYREHEESVVYIGYK